MVLVRLQKIVSIHAPVWVRLLYIQKTKVYEEVSIHAPVWVRHLPSLCSTCCREFQFTHPCGCDGTRSVRRRRRAKFQFTHPCGCDYCPLLTSGVLKVSIHAPVWVRRVPCRGCGFRSRGFNSRTRVGATSGLVILLHGLSSFNSRTRVGATIMTGGFSCCATVSIHAPVWVRQEALHILSGDMSSFNSRTRVGATRRSSIFISFLEVSIHAPVWVRRRCRFRNCFRPSFQFTHPCGCDGLTNTV